MANTASSSLASAAASRGRLLDFWDSTVGKKVVMAVTGMAGIGFVLVHMAGNLQMFKPEGAALAMHNYAASLRALGPLLWIARGGLVVCVVFHVMAAVQLTARNRAARPVAYAMRKAQTSTLGSRSMRIGGIVLFAFIVFHILDMTLGVGHPQFTHLDPYNNLRIGFSRWWATAFYLLAVALLGLHLYHGVWASWRTIGARRESPTPRQRTVAFVLTIVIALGFAAVPIAAALGWFPEAPSPGTEALVYSAPVAPEVPSR